MAALTRGGESLCAAMSSDESTGASQRPETRRQLFLSRLAEMSADIVRTSLDRPASGLRANAAVAARLPALY